jgi:hypothetical protein
MIASTGSKIVSISRIPVSLIVSRIEALIAVRRRMIASAYTYQCGSGG